VWIAFSTVLSSLFGIREAVRLVGSDLLDLIQFWTYQLTWHTQLLHSVATKMEWVGSIPSSKYNFGKNNTTLTFSCWKRVRILISLSVRWQYVWCSKGRIFLIATFIFFWVSVAELEEGKHDCSKLSQTWHTHQSKIDNSPYHPVGPLSDVGQTTVARTDVKSLPPDDLRRWFG